LVEGVKLLCDDCIYVRYEDLISNPSVTLSRIFDFLEIEYSVAFTQYRSEKTWSFGDQIGVYGNNKPDPNLSKKWEAGFSNPNHQYIAYSYLEFLGPYLVNKMGYDFEAIKKKVGTPTLVKPIIPWNVLIKKNDFLINLIEKELCINPHFLMQIIQTVFRMKFPLCYSKLLTMATKLKFIKMKHSNKT
jgi:hypothetical protein